MYEWQGKEAECYQLYVEEHRSLTEVMAYFKERHDFSPSKRAWQTQIKKWAFPSKLHPAWHNDILVARVRQLWEQSMPAKRMLATLQREGFDVKERDLMRLRSKRKWLLRGNGLAAALCTNDELRPNKVDASTSRVISSGSTLDQADSRSGSSLNKTERGDQQTIAATSEGQSTRVNHVEGDSSTANQASTLPELDPEIRQRRQEHLAQLAADSEELWASKKRRRRTRGWAGLPADPPQAPRFPSETTIDESKAYLHLDNTQWAVVRTQFTSICRDAGVMKKTTAGAERWQAVKDRLVHENPHLHNEFFGSSTEYTQENKSLGLDVLCLDIVKRLRSLETRMTLGEARNILGLNPVQAEQARETFRAILRADRFVSKLATGEQRWRELQQDWVQSQPCLHAALPVPLAQLFATASTPMLQTRLRAVDILSTDIMKRLREEQNRADADPNRSKYTNANYNGSRLGPSTATRPEGAHLQHQSRYSLPSSHEPVSSSPMTAAPGQQHMQALIQQLTEPQTHALSSASQYQPAEPPSTTSPSFSAEHRLRQGLNGHPTLAHQGGASQENGQIDPFLLAVANSNEWSADEFGKGGTAQAAAQRLQAYAASASRDQ